MIIPILNNPDSGNLFPAHSHYIVISALYHEKFDFVRTFSPKVFENPGDSIFLLIGIFRLSYNQWN